MLLLRFTPPFHYTSFLVIIIEVYAFERSRRRVKRVRKVEVDPGWVSFLCALLRFSCMHAFMTKSRVGFLEHLGPF